jgi:hypothetical protein
LLPFFGVETITVVDALRAKGTLVNDPSNPGRMYLCGKGIALFDSMSATATGLMATMREASEERIRLMTVRLEEAFEAAGLRTGLSDASIAAAVAQRAGVPRSWVSLQERHVARAFQEAVFRVVPARDRPDLFERLYRAASAADPTNPIGVQEEIRSRLMKAGRVAFVPEAAVSFEDSYRLILELGGIPCYPTLADGTSPICGFEDPPEGLAERVLARNVFAAEFIPRRNRPEVLDRYVQAFERAGIIVVAGTEHNTPEMIPLRPACLGGAPISEASELAFWEGACVLAAHQHLVAAGEPGYVDAEGRLNGGFPDGESRRRWFHDFGASLIGA